MENIPGVLGLVLTDSTSGPVISGFSSSSPAAEILLKGDVIMSVESTAVNHVNDVKRLIAGPAGTVVSIVIGRGNKTFAAKLFRYSPNDRPPTNKSQNREAGLGVVLIPKGNIKVVSHVIPFGTCSGVIQKGDIIVAVDGKSLQDYHIDNLGSVTLGPEGSVVTIQFVRGSKSCQVSLRRKIVRNNVATAPAATNRALASFSSNSPRQPQAPQQISRPASSLSAYAAAGLPGLPDECICPNCIHVVERVHAGLYNCEECKQKFVCDAKVGNKYSHVCEICSRATGRCSFCFGPLSQSTVYVPAKKRGQ